MDNTGDEAKKNNIIESYEDTKEGNLISEMENILMRC